VREKAAEIGRLAAEAARSLGCGRSLFHAREHLHDLARLLDFMLGDQKQDWLAARLADLDYGDIDGICAAARAYSLTGVKKDDLDTALGYFENNAPRMRCKWFRSRGLFTGPASWKQAAKSHRPAPQTIRHAVDRRRRHRHAPLPARQPPDDRIWSAPRNQTPAA
jgi:hypothetical protein